jgi:elongator complex protein 3
MTSLTEEIIIQALKNRITNRHQFLSLVRKMANEKKLTIPSIAQLRQAYLHLTATKQISQNKILERILQKRAIRTLSGVAIITVLTKPYFCPGRCVYCPLEKGMPKSYLKNEPAAARAYRLNFNPYQQVIERLRALEANGHPTDKIELIIKGGSWSVYPWSYQQWFIKRCFEACNNYYRSSQTKETSSLEKLEINEFPNEFSQILTKALEKEQKKNEKAHHRIVGLTLETRPDLITREEIIRLRKLGCTRVELGVQHTEDKILEKIKRGHNLAQVKLATKLLKDAGFKVDYHLMPMLPGTTPTKDCQMFKMVFEDPNLRPDMIKIYPCTVIKGSELYQWWLQGKYHPYSEKKLIELLIKVKSTLIPFYCRISRLIRDIPSTQIEAGNRITNLREVIQNEMKKRGLKCPCLRCREVGHQESIKTKNKKLKMFIERYSASGGIEFFLSIEDKKRQIVYAFCRLRFPSGENLTNIPEIKNAALIRELHTYGHLVPLTREKIITNYKTVQHTGLGHQLMNKAEEIAQSYGFKKMAVIAGIGVREYYRKLGYRLKGTYMVKSLKEKT